MKTRFALALILLSGSAFADANDANTITVPVLKAAVQKGAVITPDNIVDIQVPANKVFASTITSDDQLTGLATVRPLAAGEPINRLHVKAAAAVSRNDLVSIRFSQGAVELVVKGQALEDGQVGQTIKVINPNTRATVAGIVRENGVIDIN